MENSITFVKLDKRYYDTLKEWWHSDRVKQYLENYDYFKEQKTKKLVPSENISHDRRK